MPVSVLVYVCICIYICVSVCLSVYTGMRTGRCVKSYVNSAIKTCEIHAWCPVERTELPMYVLFCCEVFQIQV